MLSHLKKKHVRSDWFFFKEKISTRAVRSGKKKTKQKKLERSCEDSEKRKGTTKGDGKVKRKKKQKQTNKKHQKKRRRELVDRNWSGSSDVTLRRPRFPTHFPANALIESRRRLRSTVSSVIVEPQRFPSDFLSFLPRTVQIKNNVTQILLTILSIMKPTRNRCSRCHQGHGYPSVLAHWPQG